MIDFFQNVKKALKLNVIKMCNNFVYYTRNHNKKGGLV